MGKPYRSIFWNLKKAFIGQKFLVNVPVSMAKYPVLYGAPILLFAVAHSGLSRLVWPS